MLNKTNLNWSIRKCFRVITSRCDLKLLLNQLLALSIHLKVCNASLDRVTLRGRFGGHIRCLQRLNWMNRSSAGSSLLPFNTTFIILSALHYYITCAGVYKKYKEKKDDIYLGLPQEISVVFILSVHMFMFFGQFQH